VADLIYALWTSPIGTLAVVADNVAVQAVVFRDDLEQTLKKLEREYPTAVASETGWALAGLRQIREFFNGVRREFELPLDWSGLTPFARNVLSELGRIPFATTVTYGELAARCDSPHAARAIGRVMASNRLPLILPCHRVVGVGGQLTGYSGGGGVSSKRWLLDFERSQVSS